MNHASSAPLQQFKNFVAIKFQLYNSLFTSLPFHRIEKTGIMLSLFLNNCEEGYKKKQSPVQIIDEFFQKHTSFAHERDKLDLLFRFIQYVERQVVLFDALEDAAFKEVNDMSGVGTLKHLASEIIASSKQEELAAKLHSFAIRYPPSLVPSEKPTMMVCRLFLLARCFWYSGWVYKACMISPARSRSSTVSNSGTISILRDSFSHPPSRNSPNTSNTFNALLH